MQKDCEMAVMKWELEDRLLIAGVCVTSISALLVFVLQSGQDSSRYYEGIGARLAQPLCGPLAIVNMCSLCGIQTDLTSVVRRTGLETQGVSLGRCVTVLSDLGVSCELRRFHSASDLPEAVPVLCVVRTQAGSHAVVAVRKEKNVLLVDGQNNQVVSVPYVDCVSDGIAVVPQ
jgi:hypothetical protein